MSISIGVPKELETTKVALTKNISLLETKLNSLLLSPTPSKSSISELIPLLSQCQREINEMEIELSSYSQKTKDKYALSTLRSKFNRAKAKFEELESTINNNNTNLIIDDEARSSLIRSNQNINEGSAKMTESIRLMNQTNQTDRETMHSLNKQTNMIISSNDILQGSEAFIKRTNQLLNSMINKALANKLILVCILVLLVLINIFILYIKLKKKFL